MVKKTLIDDCPEDNAFRINAEYAKRFEYNKKREELTRLKEKYGNKNVDIDVDMDKDKKCSSSDTTSTDEDEDGDLITRDLDAKILKTIGKLKAKSQEVYDKEKKFFSEKDAKKAEKNYFKLTKIKNDQEESPKITVKQFQTKQLLNEEVDSDDQSESKRIKDAINVEDEDLKRSFRVKLNGEGDFFNVKTKTLREHEEEEHEYKKFLLENLSKDEDVRSSMNYWLQSIGSSGTKDPSLGEDEKFLMDYVLNRGWVEKNKPKNVEEENDQKDIDEEDDSRLQVIELEEAMYNFRHEQPEAEKIATYVEEIKRKSVRDITNPSRKRQRESKKKRKEEERIRQVEELKRLKNLRKEEILGKLERLKKVSGNNRIGSDMESLLDDEPFDPEHYDKKMSEMFNDEFYDKKDHRKELKESRLSEEEEEPTLQDDDDNNNFLGNNKTLGKVKKSLDKYFFSMKNDPEIEKCLDEYYRLDYEDKIGDLKCRFKYTKVDQLNFGLELDDILEADEASLNTHVSIKKLAPYRPLEVQMKDKRKYGDRRRIVTFRRKLASSRKE